MLESQCLATVSSGRVQALLMTARVYTAVAQERARVLTRKRKETFVLTPEEKLHGQLPSWGLLMLSKCLFLSPSVGLPV